MAGLNVEYFSSIKEAKPISLFFMDEKIYKAVDDFWEYTSKHQSYFCFEKYFDFLPRSI